MEPIHRGEDRLHLVADEVSAQVKCLSVNPFPPRLVGFAKLGIVGPQFFAADGLRQDEEKPILGESSHSLGCSGNARRQTEQLFRGLVGIGDDDGAGDGRRLGLDEQTAAPQALEDGPTHLVDPVTGGFGDERRVRRVAVILHLRGQPVIDGADDRFEPRPLWFHGAGVGFGRREIARPEGAALLLGLGDLPLDESMRAVHEARGEIGFTPIQRTGVGQGIGRSEEHDGHGEQRKQDAGEPRLHGARE